MQKLMYATGITWGTYLIVFVLSLIGVKSSIRVRRWFMGDDK
jgi:hypothetical protein